jgi:general secretion pathway protein G
MNPDRTPPRLRRGFSLMELMVVITILGILAVLVVQNVFPMIGQSKINAAKSDIKTIVQSVNMYRMHHNKLPESLAVLVEPNPKNLNEPYIEGDGVPLDPWDNEYLFKKDGSKFEILSLGADGVEGGEGEDEDISSAKKSSSS